MFVEIPGSIEPRLDSERFDQTARSAVWSGVLLVASIAKEVLQAAAVSRLVIFSPESP